ncbi:MULTISPECIES: hypothetical protein [Pseudomonas]|uniref:DUF2059 domain-containing protein n=2 Tax=Pseudomonas TaxID=286 RepID=A0AA94JJG1_9PSED|nr:MULTISPECIES: hypothetical protein [Pseudomonas]MBT9264078.1 hypothetical protein [Pseudomonas sp. MG-9]RVD79546.1 hypothetical protein A9HBioS_0070 [Pseudomonas koreensis]WDR35355.1 hypothetical protein NN484_23125 [Pseudomonas serboccidentalis]
MSMRKLTLAILLSVTLSACGAGKDKARELIEASPANDKFQAIVDMAVQHYSPRFEDVMDQDIYDVVMAKIDLNELKSMAVDLYAAHFSDEEMDVMMRANRNPEKAESILSSSSEGQALLDKVLEVQEISDQQTHDKLLAWDSVIVDTLTKMNDDARRQGMSTQ